MYDIFMSQKIALKLTCDNQREKKNISWNPAQRGGRVNAAGEGHVRIQEVEEERKVRERKGSAPGLDNCYQSSI